MKKSILIIMIITLSCFAQNTHVNGEKVFKKYCWGCHHQTAMAFGPPFSEIAEKRSKAQIMAYISSPKTMYKEFGYKRSVMTQLHLSPEELDAISDYILSYKGKK